MTLYYRKSKINVQNTQVNFRLLFRVVILSKILPRMKIFTKNFRTKWSFVKSIPGLAGAKSQCRTLHTLKTNVRTKQLFFLLKNIYFSRATFFLLKNTLFF
jgi:hypothetical protein